MKISPEEFLKKRLTNRPSHVFDVRDAVTYQTDHLIAAHNLPLEQLDSNVHRLPFSGELLFYDSGDGSAEKAMKILEDYGFEDKFFVAEGYEQLKAELENSPYDIRLSCKGDDSKELKMEVMQNLLDFEINPQVAAHGGFFELIDVEGNNVYVQLGGGCQGCGMADVTLRQGVETRMREAFPDLVQLVDVTDHASGENPYIQPEK